MEDVSVKVKTTLDAQKVPIKYWQWDDWCARATCSPLNVAPSQRSVSLREEDGEGRRAESRPTVRWYPGHAVYVWCVEEWEMVDYAFPSGAAPTPPPKRCLPPRCPCAASPPRCLGLPLHCHRRRLLLAGGLPWCCLLSLPLEP